MLNHKTNHLKIPLFNIMPFRIGVAMHEIRRFLFTTSLRFKIYKLTYPVRRDIIEPCALHTQILDGFSGDNLKNIHAEIHKLYIYLFFQVICNML